MSGEVGEENNLANFQQLTNLVLAGDQTDADQDPSKKQRTSEKPFKSDTYLYFDSKLIIDKLHFWKKVKQGAKFPFLCSINFLKKKIICKGVTGIIRRRFQNQYFQLIST